LALRSLAREKVSPALALVMAGTWIVALAVPIPMPFLWPVFAVVAIIPVVLGAPHLERGAILLTIGFGAAVMATVGVVGLLGDDAGVIEDIDDTLELIVVVGSLATLIVPIGLVIAQTNRLQRLALQRANSLNAELQESERNLLTSRRRVVDAADNERIRIERDLHDGAQQRLVALGVQLRLLESRSSGGSSPGDLHEFVSMLVGEVDQAANELRELAHGIYPPLLEARGLGEAFSAVARRSPVAVEVNAEGLGRCDPSVESALYFTGLEALANAAKHAPGATVTLRLQCQPGNVVELTVTDDGPGFETTVQRPTRGMLNMSDRIAALGGAFSVQSTVGAGTKVSASVPTGVAE
jgi:signal transduction histidine kinase